MPAGNAVRNRVAVSVLSAGLACTILHAEAHPAVQEPVKPQSTIKVQAPSVVVDVIVTDKKGRHVPALRAGDFTVYDDGVPQKIDSFESTFAPTPQKVQQQGRPATLEAAPNPP